MTKYKILLSMWKIENVYLCVSIKWNMKGFKRRQIVNPSFTANYKCREHIYIYVYIVVALKASVSITIKGLIL